MNKVILMGRLTRNPDVRYSQGEEPMSIARFTLAVDRAQKQGLQSADFISCVAFKKLADFVEKYLSQGKKIVLVGRIETGSYTDKEGRKVYTTTVVAESIEFAESKEASHTENYTKDVGDGFMQIPDGVEEEGLPFS